MDNLLIRKIFPPIPAPILSPVLATFNYQRIVWLLLILFVVLATRGLIFIPRDPNTLVATTIGGHEWEYNLWRILGMSSALADGMPGRWLESFSHGWGYPLYHYTGPLPYTLGALFYLLGFEVHNALNLCWLLAYAGSGITMFLAARRIYGRSGALLASACYLFAPYHLVDTYVRTNLVETTAFIFPPLILLGLWSLRSNPVRGIIVGVIGIAFIPLSHILSLYLIGLGLIVFCLVYLLLLPMKEKRHFVIHAGLMGSLGLGLSAFFWLPAVVDIPAVKGFEAMVDGFYSHLNHFVYPQQLISHYWGYGGSARGMVDDTMSLSLGLLPVAIAVTTLALVFLMKTRQWWHRRFVNGAGENTTDPLQKKPGQSEEGRDLRSRMHFTLACMAAGAFCAFMSLYHSSFLWEIIPKIKVAQFPWRFLFPASFFLSLSLAAFPSFLAINLGKKAWLAMPLTLLLCAAIVTFHWDFAKPGAYLNSPNEKLIRSEFLNFGLWTTNQHEFLPVTTRLPWKHSQRTDDASFYNELLLPEERILDTQFYNGGARLELGPGAAGTLILNQHWHPAWKASADGKALQTRAFSAHPFAPVAVDIPKNTTFVEFRYGLSAAGFIGIYLALLIFVGACVFLFWKSRLNELLVWWPAVVVLIGFPIFIWLTATPSTARVEDRLAVAKKSIYAKDFQKKKRDGSVWDGPGNAIFDESGIRIVFSDVQKSAHLEVSLDSNDQYMIYVLLDDVLQHSEFVPERPLRGLSAWALDMSNNLTGEGYDNVLVLPVSGDGYYSVGHITTSSEASVDFGETLQAAPYLQPLKVELEAISRRVRRGSRWDAEHNKLFGREGIDVVLPEISRNLLVELGSDSNDAFLVGFMKNGKVVATSEILPSAHYQGGGINVYRTSVPQKAQDEGFDLVRLVPTFGDDYYSLAYLKLR